ncbi:hypothetical protein NUU61_001154 [Penicillium alfredii]|uniref:Threonyl/alanyl tRNA synthetase SAD domain-containing protein n=1 Tax=Penicillium alfredii TaxID=1506179 RepID=A0A9W9KRC7_9EURO|nr:uncharacterized protein NUU61_001154 [Penicillium alfredii]KAJ5115395.1 hypothetical protein NUU61_001154 [Penicillium alfredii]
MAHTEAVYLHDASLRTLTTEILAYQPTASLPENEQALARNLNSGSAAITTRQTIFYPQGGGQPSDTGSIAPPDQEPVFNVTLVRKGDNGRILHFGETLHPTNSSSLATGQLVVQSINGPARDYHSRLHTAGHILDLAMQILMPEMKNIKANHFPGEASLEYKGLVYGDRKPLIQEKVDELVRRDLPVLISWLEEDCHTRVASIGGLDQTPCGGTHVERTGLVGSVVVRKISRQKGVSRVSYDVSPDAH